ncbi:hypothetical protein [Paraburkholderia sp.]|uniref:hypothetical protein n=1 Tax=Paraburkholderia sp. TaxID=1926495 RepID=UPI0023A725A3|nr:hypothetical protein [Paraburkholderia sp.]MDE1179747.1 hypothetical protein [Paraburkholderia sp.]
MNPASIESQHSTRGARVSMHTADDAQLVAFNAAFSDLGLRFRWDKETLDALNAFDCDASRVTAYIERHHAHLLKAYDAEFLAQLILHKKSEYYSQF